MPLPEDIDYFHWMDGVEENAAAKVGNSRVPASRTEETSPARVPSCQSEEQANRIGSVVDVSFELHPAQVPNLPPSEDGSHMPGWRVETRKLQPQPTSYGDFSNSAIEAPTSKGHQDLNC